MFNFTTTHVINNVDHNFVKKVDTAKGTDKAVRLVKGLDLNLDGIVGAYVNPAIEGIQAEFTPPALAAGERLKIELRPINPANSTFANALVDKNKILYVEGPVADVPAFFETARKFQLFLYGEELLVPDADPATKAVAAPGVDIVKVEKEVLGCNDLDCNMGLSTTLPQAWTYDCDVEVTPGKDEFGTYDWMIHNLRLPTGAHSAWMSLDSDEAPMPGCNYDQITIHYEQNRGILGMNAVGELSRSHTVHVLYVPTDSADGTAGTEATYIAGLLGANVQNPAIKADIEDGALSADTYVVKNDVTTEKV